MSSRGEISPVVVYERLHSFVDEYDSYVSNTRQFTFYPNISDRRRRDILKQLNDFIRFKRHYPFFEAEIASYISEYRMLIGITLKSTSSGLTESSMQIVDRKTQLTTLIVAKIDQLIQTNMHVLYPLYEPVVSTVDHIGCIECGIENSFNEDNECVNCGFVDKDGSVVSIVTSRSDSDNETKKGKIATEESIISDYQKKLLEIQGKYNPNIPKAIFDSLASSTSRIEPDDITKTLVRNKLKEAGLTSYYKHDIFLMKWLKKKADYDFDKDQTDLIMSEIRVFVRATLAIGKDMPDFNYLIFNILKRLNIPCRYEHFDLAKTEDKQTKQEMLMRSILETLNWQFYPFFC